MDAFMEFGIVLAASLVAFVVALGGLAMGRLLGRPTCPRSCHGCEGKEGSR